MHFEISKPNRQESGEGGQGKRIIRYIGEIRKHDAKRQKRYLQAKKEAEERKVRRKRLWHLLKQAVPRAAFGVTWPLRIFQGSRFFLLFRFLKFFKFSANYVRKKRFGFFRRIGRTLIKHRQKISFLTPNLRFLIRLGVWFPRTQNKIAFTLFYHGAQKVLIYQVSRCMASGDIDDAFRYLRYLKLMYPATVLRGNCLATRTYMYTNIATRQYRLIASDFEVMRYDLGGPEPYYAGIAHLYSMNLELAEQYLRQYLRLNNYDYNGYLALGCVLALGSQPEKALRFFQKTYDMAPFMIMSHQNFAGRYDIPNYEPVEWETQNSGFHMMYDNLNRTAENQFLAGDYKGSFETYTLMLGWQAKSRRGIKISREIIQKLETYDNYDSNLPVTILSYEWVVQFGHIGLLDSFLKMASLGMYDQANYVLLAPRDKVANSSFLDLWGQHFIIIRDESLVRQIFPYQRYFGETFMCWRNPEGVAEPWTRVAAIAQAKWADEQRGPLIQLSAAQNRIGRETLLQLGIPEDGWFANLHVRESGFHKEGATGSASDHRNTDIRDYFPAISKIVNAGGYVIRLGDNSMANLPPMKNVIDYANSQFKSEMMDLFLLSSARFSIGTTSGLTTACIALGGPMLLVNCVSNDWQLWPSSVSFIMKKIWNQRENRYLTQKEITTMPIQGYLINNTTMKQNGLLAMSCTSEEISAGVKHILNDLGIENTENNRNMSETREIIEGYKASISHNPYIYGNARPVPEYYAMNPELLGRGHANQA